jgi:hypothetical protein
LDAFFASHHLLVPREEGRGGVKPRRKFAGLRVFGSVW